MIALSILPVQLKISAADELRPEITGQSLFHYISGPLNCTQTAGYLDPELCVVPKETPLATFPVPQPGGTYVDANFGATVKLLSGFGANHGYATPSAFSATGRYVAIAQAGSQVNVVETATGRVAFSGRPGSVTGDTIRWDANDDDVFYAFSGARIRKHRLSTNMTSVLVDYFSDGHGFKSISGGGTGDTSKDNWLGFWAPIEHQVCILNLNTVKTFCADYLASKVIAAVGIASVDFVNVSKAVDSSSGKRYVLLMSNPSIAVFSVNQSTGTLDFEFRGPEVPPDLQAGSRGNSNDICEPGETCFSSYHSDTFEDTGGRQYLAFVADLETPCQREVVTTQISKGIRMLRSTANGGGRTDVMPLHLCGGGPIELWTENHTGCAKKASSCVISTNYTLSRSPNDLTTPIKRTTHLSELIVIRENGSEIRRIAQTRSIQFDNDPYWSLARASISPNGGQVLWDSNFGYPNRGQAVAMASTGAIPAVSACDLNADALVGVADVQISINQVLGLKICTADLSGNGQCDVVDFQRLVNAVLGKGCKTGP